MSKKTDTPEVASEETAVAESSDARCGENAPASDKAGAEDADSGVSDGASGPESKPPEKFAEGSIRDTDHEITIASTVEALLFSTNAPLKARKIAELIGIGDAGDVKKHIETLNERYERSGASFRIVPIAKGYQMHTLAEYAPWVSKLNKARADSRLSTAALETLAIVAYKQPSLRADIEAIRGVAVGEMLVRLRELNLVRIVGRAEEIGRPLLYGTTDRFLTVFGIASLKDLPPLDDDADRAVPRLKVANDATDDAGETPAAHRQADPPVADDDRGKIQDDRTASDGDGGGLQ